MELLVDGEGSFTTRGTIKHGHHNTGRSKHSASDLHATCCREQGLETDNRRDAASFEIKFASNETSRLARTTLELRQCKQAMRAATMTITEVGNGVCTLRPKFAEQLFQFSDEVCLDQGLGSRLAGLTELFRRHPAR